MRRRMMMAPQWVDPYPEYDIVVKYKMGTAHEYRACKINNGMYYTWIDGGITSDYVCKYKHNAAVTSYSFGNPGMIIEVLKLNCTNCKSFSFLNFTNMVYVEMRSLGISKPTAFRFQECQSLTSLDLSRIDTSEVTDMSNIFKNCIALTSLDLSRIDTSKVTNMSNMFRRCLALTSLDLSNFDTSKVTSMNSMFCLCSNLTMLDLSNFDTSKATNVYSLFDGCSKLTTIKCKKTFRDWAIAEAETIKLPTALRDASYSGWEIVD